MPIYSSVLGFSSSVQNLACVGGNLHFRVKHIYGHSLSKMDEISLYLLPATAISRVPRFFDYPFRFELMYANIYTKQGQG